ncbi:hypothetical protein V6N13_051200 [Hibiscus sabdariffa]
MDLWRLALAIVMLNEIRGSFGNVITFDVKHKFAGQPRNLTAMKAHDMRRHARLLSTVDIDIPLGGDGYPTGAGLYFAKILIGNPTEEYHVQVDTGSDLLWLNCVGCTKCPTESSLGIELKQYDPKKSSTSSLVYCKDDFCSAAHDGKLKDCKSDSQCEYYVVYGDGTGNGGYFVKDTIQLQQVTGNLQTAPTNGTVAFGCGSKRSGDMSTSSEAVNGIIGFGQANSSVLSQLAESGKIKKKFAHCLDNADGGGIFAIGEVVAPNINKARMLPRHVDDGFPVVKFHFKNSLVLTAYPHDYLFKYRDNMRCIGWQDNGSKKDEEDLILLGGTSSVKVKDEKTGREYTLGAHLISSATSFSIEGVLVMFSILLIHSLHFSIA